ncbi:MAG: MoaD/ThiS family protein [Planctomycetota bacterium]|nr:MoaD/ThiS family protein [Planctomycetota bacterium]
MKILLFAGLKEAIGDEELEIRVEGRTVAEVKAELATRFPEVENLVRRSHFAVGQDYVSDSFRFETTPDEIALIPPVSGG